MVMTARLASTSTAGSSKSRDTEEEDMQQTYQKALKLLQDPILPVRAHGLLLLRQLVTTSPSKSSAKAKSLDPALVPAILSIFLQSVQDDDSYIFLNAVQGLAAMVGTFGKDVLRGLVRDYSHGLDGNTVTQQDVDTRVRIGEALGLVIRRCGDTLGSYSNVSFILDLVHTGTDRDTQLISSYRHFFASSGRRMSQPYCAPLPSRCSRIVNRRTRSHFSHGSPTSRKV